MLGCMAGLAVGEAHLASLTLGGGMSVYVAQNGHEAMVYQEVSQSPEKSRQGRQARQGKPRQAKQERAHHK